LNRLTERKGEAASPSANRFPSKRYGIDTGDQDVAGEAAIRLWQWGETGISRNEGDPCCNSLFVETTVMPVLDTSRLCPVARRA
jgi:hypothetical protein